MIRHVVIFQLEGFTSEAEKTQSLECIKSELEALPKEIQALHTLKVSFNANPEEPQSCMLEATVSNWEDLKAYSNHPSHLRIAKEKINPFRKGRVAIDIEE